MTVLVDPEPNGKELSLFHRIYQSATQILAKDGRLDPVAFFRIGAHPKLSGIPQGTIVPVQMDMPGSDVGKDAIAQALRHLVKQTDAELVLMVLESWMVKPTDEEAEYFKREGCFQVMPSKHPNRIEIVLFSLCKPNGDNWSGWVQITRDENRRPSIPAEPPKLEYLKSAGRFGNLFEDGEEKVVPLGGMTNGPASTSRS
jgi:hypothetical protein